MWLVRRTVVTAPHARLLCLPHAGGAAVSYAGWEALVPRGVELAAVELPGHGSRFGEPLFREFEPLLGALHDAVAECIDEHTVLFGHSLGALLAFELARRSEPRALVVSGCPAPHRARAQRPRSTLSDDAFARELASLGGTPREVLDNAELMELMVPILRADFAVAESYRFRPGPPLGCTIIAMGGDADEDLSGTEMAAWSELTRADFRAHTFPGDHFFIHQHEHQAVAWLVHEALA